MSINLSICRFDLYLQFFEKANMYEIKSRRLRSKIFIIVEQN